jgi:flagellar hook-associated protein 2
MSGITTGVGIFSGINSAQLIEQLLAIEARPKTLTQSRLAQIQSQQAAYLDINARITALKNVAAGFRDNNTFQTKAATSSSTDTLSATADPTAVSGTYTFIVDRLVSTQQNLSRGFANRDISGVGMSSISFESERARLDRDVELADLNDGRGVTRGRMVVTDSTGRAATIDLSRATHVSEVLEAINNNGTAQVTASVSGGKFVIRDNVGGAVSVTNTQGSTTATSLGLAGVASVGGSVTGNTVYRLNSASTLSSLNDGRGISVKTSTTDDSYSFLVNVNQGGTTTGVRVNLSDIYTTVSGTTTKTAGAVSDIGGVIDRINTAMTARGFNTIRASINPDNGSLILNDSSSTAVLSIVEGTDTTAADLGFSTSVSGSFLTTRSLLSGLQTTGVNGLKGGAAQTHDETLNFRLRSGATFTATFEGAGSVADMLAQIETDSEVSGVKRVRATLDSKGTGVVITDLTTGSDRFRITGNSGSDAAAFLGISTGSGGIDGDSVTSNNLQRKYLSRATALSTFNNGRGVGVGDFRITDSTGNSQLVRVSETVKTTGDLIDLINSRGLRVNAAINQNGDGIVITETIGSGETAGAQTIKIEEAGGTIAKNLNLLSTAAGTGVANVINGSFERTVAIATTDTLQQVMDKINSSKSGVTATIVRDGSGAAPFRLSLTSTQSGTAGRYIIDTGTFDLGAAALDKGRDARAFFGSSDAASGVAVTSSTNTIDNILAGVKIDLKSVSSTPVNLTIATDTSGIEKSIQTFITTFNTAIDRIENQTRYDAESNRRSPLLGDGTVLELRAQLFSTVQGRNRGATGGFGALAEIGISIGTGGRLTMDSTKLRDSLASDPAGVESLFTARVAVDDSRIDLGGGVSVRNTNSGSNFSTLGVIPQLEQLAKRYVDGTSAVLTGRQNQLRSQTELLNARITSMDSRLADRRQILQSKFIAMEKAIGSMQSQQSAVSSIGRLG